MPGVLSNHSTGSHGTLRAVGSPRTSTWQMVDEYFAYLKQGLVQARHARCSKSVHPKTQPAGLD